MGAFLGLAMLSVVAVALPALPLEDSAEIGASASAGEGMTSLDGGATAVAGEGEEDVEGVEFVHRDGRIVSGSRVSNTIRTAVKNAFRGHSARSDDATKEKLEEQAARISMLKDAYEGSNTMLKKQIEDEQSTVASLASRVESLEKEGQQAQDTIASSNEEIGSLRQELTDAKKAHEEVGKQSSANVVRLEKISKKLETHFENHTQMHSDIRRLKQHMQKHAKTSSSPGENTAGTSTSTSSSSSSSSSSGSTKIEEADVVAAEKEKRISWMDKTRVVELYNGIYLARPADNGAGYYPVPGNPSVRPAGALSTGAITKDSSARGLTFKCTNGERGGDRIMGLAPASSVGKDADGQGIFDARKITYGIRCVGKIMVVIENGAKKAAAWYYSWDKLSITVDENGIVSYLKNGKPLIKSKVPARLPLHAVAALKSGHSKLGQMEWVDGSALSTHKL
jgi:hypothetical protein